MQTWIIGTWIIEKKVCPSFKPNRIKIGQHTSFCELLEFSERMFCFRKNDISHKKNLKISNCWVSSIKCYMELNFEMRRKRFKVLTQVKVYNNYLGKFQFSNDKLQSWNNSLFQKWWIIYEMQIFEDVAYRYDKILRNFRLVFDAYMFLRKNLPCSLSRWSFQVMFI